MTTMASPGANLTAYQQYAFTGIFTVDVQMLTKTADGSTHIHANWSGIMLNGCLKSRATTCPAPAASCCSFDQTLRDETLRFEMKDLMSSHQLNATRFSDDMQAYQNLALKRHRLSTTQHRGQAAKCHRKQ
jgi:hypothetical protein